MARTNIPLSAFTANSSTSDPAGTAADETNNHDVDPGVYPFEDIVLRVVVAAAGDAATVTVKAGDNPPALSAGQGDLAVTCSDNATTFIGPFESARFMQDDAKLHFDIDDETGVTITAFRVPSRF